MHRKSVDRITDHPDMTQWFTVDVKQEINQNAKSKSGMGGWVFCLPIDFLTENSEDLERLHG